MERMHHALSRNHTSRCEELQMQIQKMNVIAVIAREVFEKRKGIDSANSPIKFTAPDLNIENQRSSQICQRLSHAFD